MRFWTVVLGGLAATAAAAAQQQPTTPQRPTSLADVRSDAQRAEAVREAFVHSWNGYKKYAWGSDELLPLSNRGGNSRNGWGASIADALSTAVLMELPDVVLEALTYLASVDFTHAKTPAPVSLFETTIRYLGGLLSGYDLLKGPYSHIVPPGKQYLVDRLLSQAVSLADRLSWAFNTPTGIPYNNLNFATNSSKDLKNSIATMGTLVLEWTHLSDLTGNPKYGKLAQRAEEYLLHPNPSSGEPFPGLLGTDVSIQTGRFLNSWGGWSGGSDSFYEYLLKMFIYSPSRFGKYAARWLAAAESTLRYLLTRPGFVAEWEDGGRLRQSQGQLTCFIGGNLALGGKVLGRSDIEAAGLALTKGCHDVYISTKTGIGPERWSWDPRKVPAHLSAFFAKNGWYPTVPQYNLRPEAVESFYHAYRLTGDDRYKQWAWDAFVAIDKACRTRSGYSAVSDVTRPRGGVKMDFQESFWFAEVLKYLWLTFAQKEVGVARGGRGEWVFNTEAHPLRVAAS